MVDEERLDLGAAIDAIWLRNRDLMLSRISGIDVALLAAAHGRLDPATRAAAQRDAHNLAGALGTFGLHEGTTFARHIELALAGDTAFELTDLKDAARRLRAQLESR